MRCFFSPELNGEALSVCPAQLLRLPLYLATPSSTHPMFGKDKDAVATVEVICDKAQKRGEAGSPDTRDERGLTAGTLP